MIGIILKGNFCLNGFLKKVIFGCITPEELIGSLNDVEKKFAPKCIFVNGDKNILQENPKVSVIGLIVFHQGLFPEIYYFIIT